MMQGHAKTPADEATRSAAAAAAAPPLIRFEAVGKRFGAVGAVQDVSLDIREGEFFALLGPSGCGKTTLLRMVAGFERPSAGRILLDGVDVTDVPPHRRPVNMMFQSYALFPHLTVAGNVAFGLRQERLPKAEIEARVDEMLALVRLEGLGGRRPQQLSGGQRQRVALARALVKRPRVLLLDEPLSALDRRLREDTRFELVALQRRLGLTFIVVTHDQEEAMSVADRIGVMQDGRLVQVGSPAEIYERPCSLWVAGFIGDINLIEGRVVSSGLGQIVIEGPARQRLRAVDTRAAMPGTRAWMALRPEKIEIGAAPPAGNAENSMAGRVAEVGYLGSVSILKVKLDNGLDMKVAVANRGRPIEAFARTGGRVWLSFAPEAAVVLLQ